MDSPLDVSDVHVHYCDAVIVNRIRLRIVACIVSVALVKTT